MSLHNKKVKIIPESYTERRDVYSSKFLQFIEENQDKIFTAKKDKKYENGEFYTLKESEINWCFHQNNLRKVKL